MLFIRLGRATRAPITFSPLTIRSFTTASPMRKWEGSNNSDHVTNGNDSHNVQHDASRDGKEDRAQGPTGTGARSAGEGAGESNKKAKDEFPEAPDTIGMQDQVGGKE